jgi:hypothetical protein
MVDYLEDSMIFRRPSTAIERGARSFWPVFLETQRNIDPPYGIVLQPEHARLSGDLARHLREEVFGPIPDEVLNAIAQHDAGWQEADQEQLDAIGREPVKPFPLLPRKMSIPCWEESIRRAEAVSPLTGVIVSRHFCALGIQDEVYGPFLEKENPRREHIERTLGIGFSDLDRWTDAIGFCDVLSLYLCSGTRQPVEFPLAHPALPGAREARKVVIDWDHEKPRFPALLLPAGTKVSVEVQQRENRGMGLTLDRIDWQFTD